MFILDVTHPVLRTVLPMGCAHVYGNVSCQWCFPPITLTLYSSRRTRAFVTEVAALLAEWREESSYESLDPEGSPIDLTILELITGFQRKAIVTLIGDPAVHMDGVQGGDENNEGRDMGADGGSDAGRGGDRGGGGGQGTVTRALATVQMILVDQWLSQCHEVLNNIAYEVCVMKYGTISRAPVSNMCLLFGAFIFASEIQGLSTKVRACFHFQ